VLELPTRFHVVDGISAAPLMVTFSLLYGRKVIGAPAVPELADTVSR
jgi:hypothetical protein